MEYKRPDVLENVRTRDINEISEKTGNIYKSVVVCAKRANQISAEIKNELSERLEEYSVSFSDNLEEIHENKEQIEVSKYYEKLPKASLIALEDLLNDNIYFANPEEEEKENSL